MPFDPVTWILARNAGASGAADVIEGLSEGLKFKGAVNKKSDLPASGNDGDMYIIEDMEPGTGKAIWYNAK